MEAAVKMNEKNLTFSKKAEAELNVLCKAVKDIVTESYDVFSSQNLQKAQLIEPLEDVIDGAIVGSHFIKLLKNNNYDTDAVKEYISGFKAEM